MAQKPRAYTRVKPKSQVTIPKAVLDETGIKVGDLLEARVSRQGVLLVPQAVMDRKLEDLRQEIKKGLESGRPIASEKVFRELRKKAAKHRTAARG